MKIVRLGWEEIAKIHEDLAKKIEKDGLPDALVVISRGGNITGTHLSHLLGVRDLYPLLIKRTENDEVCAKKITPEVKFLECLDVQNKNILIVDDIVGSGESMEIAKKTVFEAKAKTVRSAVLIVNKSNFKKDNLYALVDYIGKTVKTWTVFPWERTK
jgi:uncharacterized protein